MLKEYHIVASELNSHFLMLSPKYPNSFFFSFCNSEPLYIRLTRVVADTGAGSTIETFWNSELIFAIFKFFALKFSERTSIKVLENKCENKASL